MRKSVLSASLACFAIATGSAWAQETPQEMPAYTNDAAGAELTTPVIDTVQLEGQNVFDENGQPVGTVEAIVTAEDGSQDAILSVGGFLGLGAKKISIGVDELQPNADGSGYTISMTAEEVEAAPAYERAPDADQPVNE